MTDPLRPDPASFRDPSSVVLVGEDEVFRAFSREGLADFEALTATRFYADAVREGRLVKTDRASDLATGRVPGRFAGLVRHEPVPFISYPYEWSFQMLKDAASLTLQLLRESLDEGMTMKDATPYNVQFIGSMPTFIDLGSFERRRPGEPWYGYLQFCQMFLYPLMLQAYLGIPFQPWLRSSLEGIRPQDARRLVSGRHCLRRGSFKHVHLHARLQSAFSNSARTMEVQADLKGAGFRQDLVRSNLKGLSALVGGLESKDVKSEWSDYSSSSRYDESDEAAKEAFVNDIVSAAVRRLVWDLGANDGRYSAIAARAADLVLAIDSDHVTVDRLYRKLKGEKERRVLPLLLDVANPSPGTGWRGRERASFADRGRPALILMLALVHHLAISRSIPLSEIVGWLAEQGGELVIEFPTPEDVQVQKLFRNKREGLHASYNLDAFESALQNDFHVLRREALPSGTRILYYARSGAASSS